MRLRAFTILLLFLFNSMDVIGVPLPLPAAAPTQPNFVVIVVDDLDTKSLDVMSGVEADLIAEGASFSNFFATTPLCCPSRASILRGQYAHNHGVLRNTGENAGFDAFAAAGEEQVTVATLLDGAGYETALVGKYLNGYANGNSATESSRTYIPPGWDYWVAGIDHAAYRGYKYSLNVNAEIVQYGDREEDYSTDVLTNYALDFLDQATAIEQPFFLYLAPYAPHSPVEPAPRHKGMFNGVKAPRTRAFNERNVRDKPQWVQKADRFSDDKISRIDAEYQRRLEAVQAVDDMVKAVVQRLRDANKLDSTYIVFLSDNGIFLGEHRQPHGKDAPYDPAARIPLVITGPSIAPGITVDQLALNIDLTPTIADLAGLAPPEFVDGRSLTPILTGNATGWRNEVLLEGFGSESESLEGAELPTPAFRALRTESSLYAEYDTGERELYDLKRDPDQLENIARDTPKATLVEFSRQLDALATCAAATCRVAEDSTPPSITATRDNKSRNHDRQHNKHREKKRKKSSHDRNASSSAESEMAALRVGGSEGSTATMQVRLPKRVSAADQLMLQVYVEAVTSPGTLVATLVNETATENPTAERVGSGSITATGWATIPVPDLFGDSGSVWLALSGRDGADLAISPAGSTFAPRLTSSERAATASAWQRPARSRLQDERNRGQDRS